MIPSDDNVFDLPDPQLYQDVHLPPSGPVVHRARTRGTLSAVKPGTGSLIETRNGPRRAGMVGAAHALKWAWGDPASEGKRR